MPEVKPLTIQLRKFYEMLKLTVADEQLLREAWGFKAACGFVKRKGRREELTTDPQLNFDEAFLMDQPRRLKFRSILLFYEPRRFSLNPSNDLFYLAFAVPRCSKDCRFHKLLIVYYPELEDGNS